MLEWTYGNQYHLAKFYSSLLKRGQPHHPPIVWKKRMDKVEFFILVAVYLSLSFLQSNLEIIEFNFSICTIFQNANFFFFYKAFFFKQIRLFICLYFAYIIWIVLSYRIRSSILSLWYSCNFSGQRSFGYCCA